MADHYTNMSDLLTALKERLLLYQTSTLSAVKTWKRGVLPPIPTFPALAILPVNEALSSPRSGGAYRCDRELLIEIYTKGLTPEKIMKSNLEIVEAVKDVLKTEYELDHNAIKRTYDLVMDTHTLGEPYPFKNSIVQKSTIPVICRSLEKFPTMSARDTGRFDTSITDSNPSDLMDKVLGVLSSYGSYTKAPKVQRKGTLPPCMSYPSLHVLEDTDRKERYAAGVDRPNRIFTIALFNRQLDKEVLLNTLMTLTEEVKDCLQENPKFGNRCSNSWIPTVDYGTFNTESGPLYGVFITLLTWGWDPVR